MLAHYLYITITLTTKTASKYLQLSLNKLLGTQLFMVWNKQMHPLSGMGRKKTAVSNSSTQEIRESYGQLTFDRSNTQTHIHSGITWWLVLSGSDVYLVAVLTDRPRRDLHPQNPTKKAVFYNIGPCLNLFHRFSPKISTEDAQKASADSIWACSLGNLDLSIEQKYFHLGQCQIRNESKKQINK